MKSLREVENTRTSEDTNLNSAGKEWTIRNYHIITDGHLSQERKKELLEEDARHYGIDPKIAVTVRFPAAKHFLEI